MRWFTTHVAFLSVHKDRRAAYLYIHCISRRYCHRVYWLRGHGLFRDKHEKAGHRITEPIRPTSRSLTNK